jgi:glucose/arabinose dehydrogenase
MNRKSLYLLTFALIILIGSGCGSTAEESTATPPVAPAATNTARPSPVVSPTDAPVAETNNATATAVPPTEDASETAPATATTAPSVTPMPSATPDPGAPATAISLAPVTDYQFLKPTFLTHAGDERLFVTEQAGVIRIIQEGQVLPDPFLYIQDRVGSNASEQGLLSVAFHPQYDANGYFFIDYTDTNGDTVIARYQVDPDNPNRALSNSEQILLTIPQPYGNHNGGQLHFGPDGYLYVGMGDGGSANDPLNNGQDPGTLLGTILRLDVDFQDGSYAIPPDNPFVDDENGRNEIWAYGLRNPWRFSFDRLTGDLFIADVGQNMWEEIHFQAAASDGGENYGWNILEGSHCFQSDTCDKEGLELPIFEYSHNQGCSVTGGYVYRGEAYPELNGNYFLSDYCSGAIWSLYPDGEGGWQSNQVYTGAGNISTFGEDVNGELYVLGHLGTVSRIQP